MIKKILSAIICVSLLMSVIPTTLGFAADDALSEHYELVDTLLALGIYSENDNMVYGNDTITREELATILSVFYGVTEESYVEKTSFPDVVEDWTSGHIALVSGKGILNGYTDGLFRPKAHVTKGMLCKALITMTGYGIFAESEGGYPDGYIEVADDLEILTGVGTANPDAKLTRAELTAMLYNALFVPLLQRESFGEDNDFEMDEDITLLTEKLNIYTAEGTVLALPYTSLRFEDGAGKNMVTIDSVSYKTNVDLYESLGSECQVYFKQSDNEKIGTILYANPLDSGKDVIEVNAEDIISFGGNTFRYYEGTRAKSLTVPTDFMLIFNGKRLTNYTKAHITPKQGRVRLCDLDGDKKYDRIIVDSEVNYRVDSLQDSEDEYFIVSANGKSPIRIAKNDEYNFVFYKKGQKCEFKDLAKNDVLSVVADQIDIADSNVLSTSRVFRIYATDSSVSGVVTGTDGEGIYVDDVFYALSPEIEDDKNSILSGKKYTFYLNQYGDIADFEGGASNARYGIILDYTQSTNGLATDKMVKIYDQDGEVLIYDCLEKLKIDGYGEKSYLDVESELKRTATKCQSALYIDGNPAITYPSSYWQVIKYQVSDAGELLAIDTLEPNAVVTKDDLVYNGGAKKEYGEYSWYSPVFVVNKTNPQLRFTFDANAKIIGMEETPTSEDHYVVRTISNFNSDGMGILVFDEDEMGVAHFGIRIRNNETTGVTAADNSNFIVYEGTRRKLHSDGEVYDSISGTNITSGAIVTYPLKDGVTLPEGVKHGDIITFSLDSDGLIKATKAILVRDDYTKSTYTSNTVSRWSGGWASSVRIGYGRLESKSEDYFRLTYDIDQSHTGAPDFSEGTLTISETLKFGTSTKYWIYDSKTNTTKAATKADLRDYRNFGDDADMVAGRFSYATPSALVIYR